VRYEAALTSITDILKKLNRLLAKRHKVYFLILVALTLILAFIEVIGLSTIMPFISVVSNPSLLDTGVYKKAFDLFHFISKNDFIIAFGCGVIFFLLFRAVCNVGYTYIQQRVVWSIFRYLVDHLFETFIAIPYKLYARLNSSELTKTIVQEAFSVTLLVNSLVQLCAETFIIALLYGLVTAVNWKMTLVLTLVISIMIWLIMNRLTGRERSNGIKRAEGVKNMFRIIGETFGNFKFVKLKGTGQDITYNFDCAAQGQAKAEMSHAILNGLPRFIMETTGFLLLIMAVIFIIWRYHSAEQVIPVLSMYALALYRILPASTRMLSSLNVVIFQKEALNIVYGNFFLETEEEGPEILKFNKTIEMRDVSFSYQGCGAEVLNDIVLEIRKGEKIAIVGESGGGKSTLVDLLIGIHRPSSGGLYIDGVLVTSGNIAAWRSRIGYIPQDIYLFDGTVGDNVTFGSAVDEEKLIRVLQMANIWDFLMSKDGTATLVGERGIQLSGGQKQRIGIARALYTDPEVLVLDEATSSLDAETEAKIMDEIYRISGDKTLIVVAHRLSTVERCGRKVRIEAGRIRGIE